MLTDGIFCASKYYSALQVRLHRIPSAFASIIYLCLVLEDRAGGGVDLVAILHAAGFELDLIDERAVLVVQFDLHVIRFIDRKSTRLNSSHAT